MLLLVSEFDSITTSQQSASQQNSEISQSAIQHSASESESESECQSQSSDFSSPTFALPSACILMLRFCTISTPCVQNRDDFAPSIAHSVFFIAFCVASPRASTISSLSSRLKPLVP